jgi:cellulose synthase (UDP-forming)
MSNRISEAGPAGAAQTILVHSRLAQFAAIAYFAVGAMYLWWRTFHTVNLDAPWVSFPFLFADYVGFAFFGLFATTLWTRTKRQSTPPAPGKSVDVFVTTYDEDLDILGSTVAAAVAMDYPHTTYVLDDGRRQGVRALCKELGARYLTRDDNKGAKAGNINAALPRTTGEYIVFFDADHAPFQNFLTDLLGYFHDPLVALVQTPQSYYNLDSFQHARAVRSRGESPWHEQSVFYDAILPGKDRWNAAFWCGSGAIIRREALTAIGGVDTRTVTEDMHTTMSIHAAGWRSVYHDHELAVGIAPDDADAFLGQRLRWTQGAVQIFRHDNPLLRRGLTWKQRLSYFASVAYVFEYIPKAIYLVTPIVALSAGTLPMTNMGWNLLYRFVPYWLLGVIASRLLTGGTNPYFQSERFHLAKMMIALQATAALVWPGELKFKVTPKSGDGHDHRLANLRLIRWQVGAGIASVAAVIWASVSFWGGAAWQLTGFSLLITTAWALYNAGMIASLARSILQRPHRRHLYRFGIDLRAFVSNGKVSAPARIDDLSSIGAGWISPLAIGSGEVLKVRFEIGESTPVEAQVRIVSVRRHGQGFRYGSEFVDLPEDARRRLVLFLYQQHAPTLFAPAEPAAPEQQLAA